jgi:hypothetical protein
LKALAAGADPANSKETWTYQQYYLNVHSTLFFCPRQPKYVKFLIGNFFADAKTRGSRIATDAKKGIQMLAEVMLQRRFQFKNRCKRSSLPDQD